MKVAVYAIAKNEAQFVPRFMVGVREADEVVVLDTGSTDGTPELLEMHGAKVHRGVFSRWRFDDARNMSLALVSPDVDVAVCLDLDELLVPGWRRVLEQVWAANPGITRLRYPYTWSWTPEGEPGLEYMADKIHVRHGYRWRLPVHEVLDYAGPEVQVFTEELRILHFPDHTKSRGSYLPLLEMSHAENPNDDRVKHYYARELMFSGQLQAAAVRFKEHITMPSATWQPERAQSMLYLARCEPAFAVEWTKRAVETSPDQRETWYQYALALQADGDLEGARHAARTAEELPRCAPIYLSDPEAQGDGPRRLLATLEVTP